MKYICFLLHYLLILYVIYPFSPYNTILTIIIYISWLCNNNKCILSEIEYYYYNETLFFQTKVRKISKYEKNILIISQIIKFILLHHNILMLQTHNYFQLLSYYYH
jgi:hypothetical protein